jgi:hypothetical protein
MSQNVTLQATISAAQSRRAGIEALESNESEQWSVGGNGSRENSRFPEHSAPSTHYAWLCTAVDRRSKKILKTAISATSGTPGTAARCHNSIRKSLRAKHIRPVLGGPGRRGSRVGIGAPKLPRRFPPHVHYLRLKSLTQITLPRNRQRDVRRSASRTA